MDLCEQLDFGMKKILKAYPKDIFYISDHFISVNFQYNQEAMDILSNNNNGGVSGGISGGININEAELSENTLLVLKAIERNGKIIQLQISDTLEIPVRTVQRAMKELRNKEYIQREGSTRSGQYIVLKHFLGSDSK